MFLFLALVTIASALPAPQQWTGPLASHVLGQVVMDTPEVAAARQEHLLAVENFRSLLASLPPFHEGAEGTEVPAPVVPEGRVAEIHDVQVPLIPETRAAIPVVSETLAVAPVVPETLAAVPVLPEVHSEVAVAAPAARAETPLISPALPLDSPAVAAVPVVPEVHSEVAVAAPRAEIPSISLTHPLDNPEVEAAKQAHFKAHQDFLAILAAANARDTAAAIIPAEIPLVVEPKANIPLVQPIEPLTTTWTGPLANHVLGQVVAETPEVAKARLEHAAAYNQFLRIIPALPSQEGLIASPLPVSFAPIGQPAVRILAPGLSPILETPEVAAARLAHLAAHQEALARVVIA